MKTLLVLLAAICATASASRVVCYYSSWAVYRTGPGKYEVTDIDPTLCTHLVYAFIGLGNTGDVQLLDPYNDVGDEWHQGQFQQLQSLKTANPEIKLLLAIGGFNHGPGPFQLVVRDPAKRAVFVQSAFNMITQYKFDGLDIDWEYPDGVGGTPEDKVGLSLLLQEMRAKFDESKFVLSIATPANLRLVENCYELANVSKYVDSINIMAYDFHGSWEYFTGHVAPLRASTGTDANLSVESVLKYYINNGADPAKLTLGIVAYGRTWLLTDPKNNTVGAPAKGPGPIGTIVPEGGILAYADVCQNKWPEVWDSEALAPYAFKDDLWVTYDNAQSIAVKAGFAKALGVTGIMVWSIETDDKLGTCTGETYPILRVANNVTSSF